jgi:hypothetical protein
MLNKAMLKLKSSKKFWELIKITHGMDLADVLKILLEQPFYFVDCVAFDLDETLGHGGWIKNSLKSFIAKPLVLQKTIDYLHSQNILVVLVSRNSAFCQNEFQHTEKQARALGFDVVIKCARHQIQTDKVTLVHRQTKIDKEKILLIDDLHYECNAAAKQGAIAMCIPNGPAVETIPAGNFYFVSKNMTTNKIMKTVL